MVSERVLSYILLGGLVEHTFGVYLRLSIWGYDFCSWTRSDNPSEYSLLGRDTTKYMQPSSESTKNFLQAI